ncbi:MAG TPA: hypothetical protein VFD32_14035 [Dehalococcoidia bacterium]|nr:hypothetical protein [Dehalococcoidia bacterium]
MLLAGLAVLLAAAAAVERLRRRTPTPGRLLELAPPQSYQVRQPIPFTLDEFELMKLDDGSFVALYIYPPSFFGHTQGCTIRWKTDTPNAQVAQDGESLMPAPNAVFGYWDEGCGGAQWDAAGHKLWGPGPGDLDRFSVGLRSGRVWVDTRHMHCAGSYPCQRARKASE